GCSGSSAGEAHVSETFARDRTSGSGGVARTFLDALERWAAMDRSAGAAALRAALLAWLRAAQAAQPSMALVHQLAARALAGAAPGAPPGDGAAGLRAPLAAGRTAPRARPGAAGAGPPAG